MLRVAALLILLGSAHSAFAQITAATVSGTIRDQTGGVLPGVDVTVKNAATGLMRSGVTDANGQFTVPGLPPGTYDVRASLAGFGTATERLVLVVAQQAALNITLTLGAAEETVTVIGTSPLVDTRSATLSAVVTEKTISELPLNGRNYIDLALLQPGVTSFNEKDSTASSNRGTKLNINGMSFRSNSYLLDGANMRGYAGTATVSAAETTLGIETIQEFRVATNSFSADYGRGMGGVINLVTKSGSNTVRGSAFEFFRDSSMDARNFFDRGVDPPPFQRNQFGAAGGGPLRKNRLFFFGGVERLQEDLGLTKTSFTLNQAARLGALFPINPVMRPYIDLYPVPNGGDVGVDSGVGVYTYEFNQPTRENFYQGRLDYIPNGKDSFFARYTWDGADQSVTSGFPAYGTDSVSRNSFLTSEYKRTLTSALLNTARFSHSRLRFEQVPVSPSTPELAFIAGKDQIGTLGVTGLTDVGGPITNPSTNNTFYWTFSDDVTYVKGAHVLKTGALIEHNRTNKLTTQNVRGTYRFPNVRALLAGTPTQFTGTVPGAKLERVRPNTLFGLYVQDDYRATDRLTLNLGLRYEFYTIPAERFGLDSSLHNIVTDTSFTVGPLFAKNPSLKNWAPRLGVAWDVTGDGRTALRGGAGMYYDTDGPFNSALGQAASVPPFSVSATIPNPAFPRPVSLTASAPSARPLDYNIKQPYGITYNVNLQRELPGQITATVGYAGSRAYDLVAAVEGNPTVPQIRADGTKFFPVGAPRRNPAFGPIDYRTSAAHSEYNSLQLSAQKRFSRSYQLQGVYTLAKAMDNMQGQLAFDVNNSVIYPQDPYDRDKEWTASDFDVRHVFATNFVWDLPGDPSNLLTGGWQLNGIVTLRSGVPFTATLGAGQSGGWSRSGSANSSDRPSLKPGVDPKSLTLGGPDRYLDTSGFLIPEQGTFGNVERNSFRGSNYAMTSVSLVKNTRLGSTAQAQFRFEVFNVLNRPNFATPDHVIFAAVIGNEAPLGTAGRISNTITSARQLQFGVKLLF